MVFDCCGLLCCFWFGCLIFIYGYFVLLFACCFNLIFDVVLVSWFLCFVFGCGCLCVMLLCFCVCILCVLLVALLCVVPIVYWLFVLSCGLLCSFVFCVVVMFHVLLVWGFSCFMVSYCAVLLFVFVFRCFVVML